MVKRLAGFVLAAASMFAQVRAPAQFDAVSVKPSAADDRVVTLEVGPGGQVYSTRVLTEIADPVRVRHEGLPDRRRPVMAGR